MRRWCSASAGSPASGFRPSDRHSRGSGRRAPQSRPPGTRARPRPPARAACPQHAPSGHLAEALTTSDLLGRASPPMIVREALLRRSRLQHEHLSHDSCPRTTQRQCLRDGGRWLLSDARVLARAQHPQVQTDALSAAGSAEGFQRPRLRHPGQRLALEQVRITCDPAPRRWGLQVALKARVTSTGRMSPGGLRG